MVPVRVRVRTEQENSNADPQRNTTAATLNVVCIKEQKYKARGNRMAVTETAGDAFSFQSEEKFNCTKKLHTHT